MEFTVLFFGGIVAGFIDSIAGGGGLITLPLLCIYFPNQALAIGSNKIVGTTGAFVALVTYARAGHLDWRRGLIYVICIGIGSSMGSVLTPHLSTQILRWIIFGACFMISILVALKPYWWPTEEQRGQSQSSTWKFWMFGVVVGFYDGAIGPGGGTFMLLAPLLLTPFPVLQCLALSKLANSISAGTALISYEMQGLVSVHHGVVLASGMALGAFLGSRLALRHFDRVLRPALFVISVLLLLKLAFF